MRTFTEYLQWMAQIRLLDPTHEHLMNYTAWRSGYNSSHKPSEIEKRLYADPQKPQTLSDLDNTMLYLHASIATMERILDSTGFEITEHISPKDTERRWGLDRIPVKYRGYEHKDGTASLQLFHSQVPLYRFKLREVEGTETLHFRSLLQEVWEEEKTDYEFNMIILINHYARKRPKPESSDLQALNWSYESRRVGGTEMMKIIPPLFQKIVEEEIPTLFTEKIHTEALINLPTASL